MIQTFPASKKLRSNPSTTPPKISSQISSHVTTDHYILAGENSDSKRDTSSSPHYTLANVAPVFHSKLGLLLNDKRFDQFILLLIIINSLLTAIVTFPFIRDDSEKREVCEYLDKGLLTIFTVELVLNLLYYGLSDFF